MLFLPPVSLTLPRADACQLAVVDRHPHTRSTLWQAAPIHALVCKVELGTWLNLWQPRDDDDGPKPAYSPAAPRGECGARRVMDAANHWPTVESLFIPNHRQVQTWDRLARSQPDGSQPDGCTRPPWAAPPGRVARHLAGAGVPTTTSGASSSTTWPGHANPSPDRGAHPGSEDVATHASPSPDWGVRSLSQCMATPGWLLAYLLQWSPKRIRAGPREHAAAILSALAGSSTSGRLEWASAGGVAQVQDGRLIDWGPFTRVPELLPELAERDLAWLDCRTPWLVSSTLWAVAGSLLAARPMPSSDRHVLREFLDWAVCQVSSAMDDWARSSRGPARDLEQLVGVQRRGLRARLPVDLLHRLASRKHPRATLEEWQASGLAGGCNTGHLARRWNNMYLAKGRSALSEAIALNLTLDATQAGGNSLEVCVAWGVEVQTCVYAPPQAGRELRRSHAARTEPASLQTGLSKNLLRPD